MKKIFITGGAGFIGSALIHLLNKQGYETASFDACLNFIDNPQYYQKCLFLRKKIYYQPSKNYTGDIRDKDSLLNVINDFNPDIIVHLAGLPMARVLEKFNHEMISINLFGTLNVLDVFEKSKAEKIVYASSSMAYGHFHQIPQKEEAILNPINIYGASKASGEFFVKLSQKKWVIVRPTSVYGFTDCANRVTQLLLDAAFLRKSAWIVRGETLDFSFIDDVADGFLRVIVEDKANFQTFNISRGESRSTIEFAEIVKEHFPHFTYEIRDPDKQQVFRGPQDIRKARQILNYNPMFSIEDGIKRIIEQSKEYRFYEN